jgi:hypothetical protein
MSDPRFLQRGFDKQLAHLVEECGEVLAAAGKTQRWGRDSVNPLIPTIAQETNEAWLRRELADLRQSIDRLEATMDADNLTDRRRRTLEAQRSALSLDNLKDGR